MKNIVIKLSSNLTNPDNEVDVIKRLALEIKTLKEGGFNVIIVTSGAVMYGLKKLNMTTRPESLPLLQSCAAIGQISLMRKYQEVFGEHGLIPAEILLSADDFKIRKRYLNLRNTIQTLLSIGVVPVFNENDSINTEELKLGDNDHLSSLITIMVDFEMLIILTDVDGLFDSDPRTNSSAAIIPKIDKLDKSYFKMASNKTSSLYTTGGMAKKLESAQKASRAGVKVFIGNGYKVSISKIIEESEVGTYIESEMKVKSARQKWLAFSPTHTSGVHIDEGAVDALQKKKSSLLPSGIVDIVGRFEKGSLISIFYKDQKIAQGLSNYSSTELLLLKGKKSGEIKESFQGDFYEEAIHKNNLYLL